MSGWRTENRSPRELASSGEIMEGGVPESKHIKWFLNSGAHPQALHTWICPKTASHRIWELTYKMDYHLEPRLATKWHTHGADFNSTAKALKMQQTLKPQPHRRLFELVGWTPLGWEPDKTKTSTFSVQFKQNSVLQYQKCPGYNPNITWHTKKCVWGGANLNSHQQMPILNWHRCWNYLCRQRF